MRCTDYLEGIEPNDVGTLRFSNHTHSAMNLNAELIWLRAIVKVLTTRAAAKLDLIGTLSVRGEAKDRTVFSLASRSYSPDSKPGHGFGRSVA